MTFTTMLNHIDELRRAYFEKARRQPVEQYQQDCQDKFTALSQAYDILKNSENMTTFIDDQMTITRDAVDRASYLETALKRKEEENRLLQIALAAALEHLQGGVLLVQDAPTDRLMVDQTIDGSYFVKLRKETN